MNPAYLLGVYQPGRSLLHRMPVGPKIAGLSAFSLAVVLVRSLPAAVVFLAVAVLAALVARIDLGLLVRSLRSVVIVALVFAGLQWLL